MLVLNGAARRGGPSPGLRPPSPTRRGDGAAAVDELAGVRSRLKAELGVEVVAANKIGVENNNNRIFRLEVGGGPPLLAKLYYQGDRQRRRLEREHDALSLLAAGGFPGVPRPVLRDDDGYWAVYTFEPGATKRPDQLTTDDV